MKMGARGCCWYKSLVPHGVQSKEESPLCVISLASIMSAMDHAEVQLRRATPRPRSGVAAERSNPMSKEWRLHRHRSAERSYSTSKVRKGDLFQGKEQ